MDLGIIFHGFRHGFYIDVGIIVACFSPVGNVILNPKDQGPGGHVYGGRPKAAIAAGRRAPCACA